MTTTTLNMYYTDYTSTAIKSFILFIRRLRLFIHFNYYLYPIDDDHISSSFFFFFSSLLLLVIYYFSGWIHSQSTGRRSPRRTETRLSELTQESAPHRLRHGRAHASIVLECWRLHGQAEGPVGKYQQKFGGHRAAYCQLHQLKCQRDFGEKPEKLGLELG